SVASGGTLLPNTPTNNNPGRLFRSVGSTDFASGSTFAVRINGNANDDASRSQLNSTAGTLTFPATGSGGTWTVDVSSVTGFTPTSAPHTWTIAQVGTIGSNGLDTAVSLTTTGTGTQTASNGTTTLRVTGFPAGNIFNLQHPAGTNTLVLNYAPVP